TGGVRTSDAVRGRDRRRAIGWRVARSLPRGGWAGRRAGLRGAGREARTDGLARLPRRAPRVERRRRFVSGDGPRPRPPRRGDPQAIVARALALRRRPPRRPLRPEPRGAAAESGTRCDRAGAGGVRGGPRSPRRGADPP